MRASIQALLLLAIVSAPQIGQAALRMNDFAYGLRLAAPEKDGLTKVDLPETVYRHINRADAGDIAIFRMDGQSVPHLLKHPSAASNTAHARDLPFSPVSNAAGGADDPKVPIRTDGDGAVLSRPATTPAGEGKAAPGYIIDHSRLPQGLEKLTLVWRRNQPNVLINAHLEASRDLIHWQTLVPAATLWDIRYGEQRLENRTIILPAGRPQGRYFRLSWLTSDDAVALEAVAGEPLRRTPLPPRRWVQALYRSDQQAAGSMQFDSGGWFPVDRVDLQLSQGKSLVLGTLQSRDSDRAVWRIHHQGLFYQLEWGAQNLHNSPVSVPETTDRYWKLDIDLRRSSLGNNVPRLMLGWRPQALFFMAERGGAYVLAYGSRIAEVLPPSAELAQALAAAGDRIPGLGIGPGMVLGGSSRTTAPPRRSSGKMVSLSSLLLGCVLLIAFFAWWTVRRILKIDSRSLR